MLIQLISILNIKCTCDDTLNVGDWLKLLSKNPSFYSSDEGKVTLYSAFLLKCLQENQIKPDNEIEQACSDVLCIEQCLASQYVSLNVDSSVLIEGIKSSYKEIRDEIRLLQRLIEKENKIKRFWHSFQGSYSNDGVKVNINK